MTLPANEKTANSTTYLLLFSCLLLIAWCANPAQLYFLNDDFIHIPMAYDGTVGHHNGIRYVMDFSLFLDSLFWKENATGYHITNLVLHIANILLAVPLLRKISTSLGYPLTTRMLVIMVSLFGVYAFHSEALFWILCRTASLSFFFNVLSWHCFFKALKQRWWVVPMIAFFLLGIFTYESLWVYPFWLLAWYWLLPKASTFKSSALFPTSVLWLFFVFYFPFRWKKQGELLGTYEATDIQEFHVLSVVVKSTKLFARSFLPPFNNTILFAGCFAVAIIVLAAFGYAVWKSKKANSLLLFFLLAWLVAYVPYIALGVSITGYESERYLYYPSFFLCVAFVYALFLLWNKQPVKRNLLLVLSFGYHIFFLVQVAMAFQKISSYSRLGITTIQTVPAGKQLIIQNLPVYGYGLPIYNYGFKKAVAWLAPQVDTNRMQVLSKTNFYKQKIQVQVIRNVDNEVLTFTGQ